MIVPLIIVGALFECFHKGRYIRGSIGVRAVSGLGIAIRALATLVYRVPEDFLNLYAAGKPQFARAPDV